MPKIPNEKDIPEDSKEWLVHSNSRTEQLAAAAAASPPPPPPEIAWVTPPPVPTTFHGGERAYGYLLTNEFMQAYFDAHPPENPEPPRSSRLWRPFKIGAISRAAQSLKKWIAYSNAEEERRAVAAAIEPRPPRPRVDFEMPPPIADHLLDCECVYGFDLTDAWMQTYFDAHPSEEPLPPRSSLLWRSRKRQTAGPPKSRGLTLTLKGIVRMRVPTASHLQGLGEVLGINEEARWFGTKVKIQRSTSSIYLS
ncbi:hypothetical protein C8R47DRAFT_1224515 [Mycena vitilis]|nr:hypothetical protein C8R47DRAFT_1224515 [Mycena vitilis]